MKTEQPSNRISAINPSCQHKMPEVQMIPALKKKSWGLPAETLSCLARSTSSGIHFLASPTKMAVDSAMHRWPAAPNAAPTNCDTALKSATTVVSHYT